MRSVLPRAFAAPLLLAAALALCSTALAAAPSPTPSSALLLGRLFDARSGQVVPEGVVVVADGRIRCAGPVDDCKWGRDAAVHDYGRAMLLPGLIDLHVHARPHYIGAFVPAGVTTVRDANNTLAMLAALRHSAGAPRIVASGPALDGPASVLGDAPSPLGSGPLEELMPITVAGADDAAAAVRALAQGGAQWIKLYDQLPPAAMDAAVRSARDAGLPVMADLGLMLTRGLDGAQLDALQAARAGVSTLEHLSGAALAYRRLGGDPLAATLDEALLDRLAGEIADSGMAVVPTVGNFRQFDAPGSLAIDDLPGAARMRSHFEGYWDYLASGLSSERNAARSAADLRLAGALLPRLVAAGVAVGAGSDLPAAPWMLPGPALHQELLALVEAGLSPVQALQSATHVAADILGRDDLGRLEAGAIADILVVEGDPPTDIRDTRRLRAVWFEGGEVDLDAAWDGVVDALEAAAAEG
ncbi:amidohydrolase family protein [Luteimonas sp. SDU101]|uniref:amidohydrolase family protein n=1 Tax=unclassified Luteimonas TaxID=2629088 RepID=UPI003EBCFC35